MSATVAIVLSNFNQAAYLRQSLSGICEQTRPADDVIVIDHGSTDNSVDVIQDFAARYPTIRLVSNPGHLGLQESIARALPLVTADYLVWVASDDRLLPSFLEKSMAVLEQHPHAGLCFSFAENADTAHIFKLADLPEFLPPAALQQRMHRAYLPMKSNSVVVRRSALPAVGDYPSDLEWYADSFAYTVVALRYGACVVPETLALIQSNQESYSERGRRSDREVEVLRKILDRLATPELRDIRRAFRRCPSNFAHWGVPMLRLQLQRARDWDLFVPYARWTLGELKRGRRVLAQRAVERGMAVPVLRHAIRAARFGVRVSRALSRRTRVRRLASIVVGALREHRRRGSGCVVRVTARIEGSVAQSTLRDLVLDQAEALRHSRANGGHVTIRGHVSIQPDADDIRLDPVLSVLCASSVLVDFSLVCEDGSAPARRPEASPSIAPAMTNVEATWARLLDPHRRMAMYVKTAHPRAFIVAFSLPEDEDGFCDAALERWLAPIVSFRRRYPMAAFCLLNRTMLLQCGRAVVEVAPIRSVGFGVHDALVLARMADAFVGGLDLYGVAALSTGRPGVYLDPTGVARSNEARDVWIVKHASEAECLARLEAILPRRRDSMSDR